MIGNMAIDDGPIADTIARQRLARAHIDVPGAGAGVEAPIVDVAPAGAEAGE